VTYDRIETTLRGITALFVLLTFWVKLPFSHRYYPQGFLVYVEDFRWMLGMEIVTNDDRHRYVTEDRPLSSGKDANSALIVAPSPPVLG
jgi:hypothetical protein